AGEGDEPRLAAGLLLHFAHGRLFPAFFGVEPALGQAPVGLSRPVDHRQPRPRSVLAPEDPPRQPHQPHGPIAPLHPAGGERGPERTQRTLTFAASSRTRDRRASGAESSTEAPSKLRLKTWRRKKPYAGRSPHMFASGYWPAYSGGAAGTDATPPG